MYIATRACAKMRSVWWGITEVCLRRPFDYHLGWRASSCFGIQRQGHSCPAISIDSNPDKMIDRVIISLPMVFFFYFFWMPLGHDLCHSPKASPHLEQERRQKHQSAWILERCVSGVRQHVSRRLPRALQSKSTLDRPV